MQKLYANDKLIDIVPDEDEELEVVSGRTSTGELKQRFASLPTAGHNCRNCGAPLDKNGDCVYCGTVRQHKSGVVMTSDSIMFYCE